MAILEAIGKNLKWFENSTIMSPPDGSWGVAERILQTSGNAALDTILAGFPAVTPHRTWSVVESRRADCNFETALYFALASETLNDGKWMEMAEHVLDFLYYRSGLLNRSGEECGVGVWNWAHSNLNCRPSFWFDDNGWVAVLQLMIGQRYEKWNKKYDMTAWGLKLTAQLATGFERSFGYVYEGEKDVWRDPKGWWSGWVQLPHWGSIPCMAMLTAYAYEPQETYATLIRKYCDYIAAKLPQFNASELTYSLMNATMAYRVLKESFYLDLAEKIGNRILEKMDLITGNLPSEHHEAPNGKHLVDTIYTANWAVLGLQNLCAMSDKAEFHDVYQKLVKLLVSIQDRSDDLVYSGSWRGMFDINAGSWGGGDSYEGGAGSVYSGWTNAPIGMALLGSLRVASMLDLIPSRN